MLDDMAGMAPPPRRRAGGKTAADGRREPRSDRNAAGELRLPSFVRLLPPPPGFLMRPFLQQFMAGLLRRHPRMFSRLGPYGERRFLIDPLDLPFVLLLVPSARLPRLEMHARAAAPEWDAAVRGEMLQLLAMAEGRADGDALFFTRDLVIEGDTEAVLALRNAIDDARLDLVEEVAATFGPAGTILKRARADLRALGKAVGHLRHSLARPGRTDDEGRGANDPLAAVGGGGGQ